MTAPTTRRVEALEAEAFRAQQQHGQVVDRLDYLTTAIGELSQGGRDLSLSVREIHARIDQLSNRMDQLSDRMDAGFSAIMTELRAIREQ